MPTENFSCKTISWNLKGCVRAATAIVADVVTKLRHSRAWQSDGRMHQTRPPGAAGTSGRATAKEPQKGKSRGRSAAASKNGTKVKEINLNDFCCSFNLPTLGPLSWQ